MHRVFTYKLGEPYNNCKKDLTSLDSFNSDLYKFMISESKYGYRQKDCFDNCIGRELLNKCNLTGQIDHWTNVWLSFNGSLTVPNGNITILDCFISVYYHLTRGQIEEVCKPVCPLECDSISYDISVSFSRFPNTYYAKRILNEFPKIKSMYPSNHPIDLNEISKKMIAFNVYVCV